MSVGELVVKFKGWNLVPNAVLVLEIHGSIVSDAYNDLAVILNILQIGSGGSAAGSGKSRRNRQSHQIRRIRHPP